MLAFLCTAVLSLNISFFALAQTPVSQNDMFEKILLHSEMVTVDGTPVRIDFYDDQGVTVQVAVPLYEKNTERSAQHIPLSKLAEAMDSTLTPTGPFPSTRATTLYEQTATSTANSNCAVYHRGYWEVADALTPFKIESTSMQVHGLWNGSGVAKKMQLTQMIKVNGLAFSLSIPLGFSVGGQSQTYTWSSLAYENTPIARAYTGEASASCLTSLLGMTVTSGSIIYVGSNSYSSTVSNDKQILF